MKGIINAGMGGQDTQNQTPDTQQANTAAPGQEQPPAENEPDILANVSEAAKPAMKLAGELLYGENFQNLIEMFKKTSPDRLHQAFSTAILGVLEAVEKQMGALPVEILGEVGAKIFELLLTDLIEGGVINAEDINEDVVLGTAQQTIAEWTSKNADERGIDPKEVQQALMQMAQQMGLGGAEGGNQTPDTTGGQPNG